MLQNKRQNYHKSKLPEPGQIVTIPEFLHALTYTGKKAIVTHFSLTDSANHRYSLGIHLAHVELLHDRNIHYTIAGHYFQNQ